jgi:hypothetical protein
MSALLERARAVRIAEADRRAEQQAALERCPPTPSQAENDRNAAGAASIRAAGAEIG